MKGIQAHFKSPADKRAALAKLAPKEHPRTPEDLNALVKAGKVADKHVNFVHVKLGGMSRARKPRKAPGKTITFKLVSPLVAPQDWPSTVAQIAQSFPSGFRSPSSKAKNWRSTSLVEQLMKIKSKFERSSRGKGKASADEAYRARALLTQDITSIPDKYLNRGSRARKAQIFADLRTAGYPERAAA